MTDPSQTPQPRRASYVWHVASVAGLDREGFAPFPVGQIELVRMLDEALDLFDTEPRFQHFTLDGQSILLEDYLSIRPENFERIEQAVQDGKLLVGPWYVEPEPFLVSGESLIRNLLIGLRTARVFGHPMLVGYMPNARGLPSQLPQILRSFGIQAVIIGGKHENQTIEVSWEGRDGTKLILINLLEEPSKKPTLSLKSLRKRLAPFSESGHLLLLHSGYLHIPFHARKRLFSSLQIARTKLPDDVFHSNPMAYAKAVETHAQRNPFPAIQGEFRRAWLADLFSLKLTAKSRNVETEHLLTQWIEPFSAWAEQLEPLDEDWHMRRPQVLIQKLWRILLENQSSVLLGGYSGAAIDRDVWTRFDHINAIADRMRLSTLDDLARHVNTASVNTQGLFAIIVFNPSNYPRTEWVHESCDAEQVNVSALDTLALYNALGNPVEAEFKSYTEGGDIDIDFLAEAIPPLGFSTYIVGSGSDAKTSRYVESHFRTDDGVEIENSYLRVTLDTATATITLVDKQRGISYPGLLDVNLEPDQAFEMSPIKRTVSPKGSSLTYTVSRSATAYFQPPKEVDLSLSEDKPYLDITINRLGEQPIETATLVRLPLPFTPETALYDSHFEIAECAIPLDPQTKTTLIPLHTLVAVFEPASSGNPSEKNDQVRRGLTIANHGVPWVTVTTYDPLTTTILLGLKRKNAQFIIIPTDLASTAESFKRAWLFADGTVSTAITDIHVGSLSLSASLIASSDPGFHLTAVKLPEDADRSGMIVRGYNTTGEPIWVTLTPWRPFATVEVVTLDEAPTGGKLAAESHGAVRFKAAPHRILTFWFHD